MREAITVTIRDRSSSGALIEFAPDKHNPEITDVTVGDEVTLTISAYQERTSVTCTVVRIEGRRCGVRFSGQFRTQIVKAKKSLSAKTNPATAPSKAKMATKASR